jgi:hypothetical protein
MILEKGRVSPRFSMVDGRGTAPFAFIGYHAEMLGPATGVADSLQIADCRDH